MKEDILNRHLTELKKIDNQRKAWLMLSALVIIAVGFIVYDAVLLSTFYILWTIGSLGVVLAVVWWYWTMRVINKVVSHRSKEIGILAELRTDVENIKKDIRKTYNKDVD